jgi:hypothetical protein
MCFLYDATADVIAKTKKSIQFAPELYSAACFVPKDETSGKVNTCCPAATLAAKADDDSVGVRELSPISLTVVSQTTSLRAAP